MHTPATIEDLCAIVRTAGGEGRKLEPRGGGTRGDFGAPDRPAEPVSLAAFSGIVDYDPAELVLTAGAGTPLADLCAAVAERGQAFAFEPWGAPGSTIGGVIAAAASGSRRVSAGAARDHLLGLRAVSGRGESFVAGAKVVKNVTGYDLPKLLCGSWGRLAALTEVTLKVLPAAPERLTLAWPGLDTAAAFALLRAALRLPADVAAAAHIPCRYTLIRIEGFGPSVAAREALIRDALGRYGAPVTLADDAATADWAMLPGGHGLSDADTLWRLNLPPRQAAGVIAQVATADARWLADWAGGLIWLASDADPAAIRAAAQDAGGHAMLVRAPAAVRARVPALHPEARGIAALSARVRAAFDPLGVFETGRFLDALEWDESDAD